MTMPSSSNSSDHSEPDHGFQIAPMVDVVFVLLLFFMALAGMRQVEKRLPGDLPTPRHGLPDLPLVIDISARGLVQCNGMELAGEGTADLSSMRTWLRQTADIDATTPVLLRPDGEATHERFIQVLAALHGVGLTKISFQ
jgi:biopolymer transport protein ExbD